MAQDTKTPNMGQSFGGGDDQDHGWLNMPRAGLDQLEDVDIAVIGAVQRDALFCRVLLLMLLMPSVPHDHGQQF